MKSSLETVKATRTDSVEFTLSSGDFSAVLTLRRLTVIETARAEDQAAEALAKYVTGKGQFRRDGTVDTSQGFTPPVDIVHDGEPVLLSKRSCRALTYVTLAQAAPEEDLYSFVELAKMCVNDELAAQLTDAFIWIVGSEDEADEEGDERLPLSDGSPDA